MLVDKTILFVFTFFFSVIYELLNLDGVLFEFA